MYVHPSPAELRDRASAWWNQEEGENLSVRGLLHHSAPAEVFLDRQEDPAAIAVSHRPFSFSLAAREWAAGERLLRHLLENAERFFSAAALAEPLVSVVEESIEPLWNTPCLQLLLPETVSNASLHDLRSASSGPGEWTSLTGEDIDLVLTHWPYGEPGNAADREFLSQCLASGPSSAWKKEGKLCSWMLTHLDGSAGFLHTLEEHRRQGLATQVVADLCLKIRAQRREAPFLYMVRENELPKALFTSVGFVQHPVQKVWIGGHKR